MNFNPTLLKSVVSIIFWAISNYIFGGKVILLCTIVEGGTCVQLTWIEHAFDPMPVIISLFVMLIVYSVWSFIQKR